MTMETSHLSAVPRLRFRAKKRLILAFGDAVLLGTSLATAFALFPGRSEPPQAFTLALPAIAGRMALMHWWGLYRVSLSFVDFRDMLKLALAMALGSLIMLCAALAVSFTWGVFAIALPVLLMDMLLSTALLGTFRSMKRIARELSISGRRGEIPRIAIVGAGSAGEQIASRLRGDARVGYKPIAFFDDNPAKRGSTIHGIPVLGSRENIPRIARQINVDELWIAMPSAPRSIIRETVELGRKADLRHVKVVPGLGALLTGRVQLADVRAVQPEDLLGRDAVRIDTEQVRALLRGKRVLVTGAAGSIGSELCRQIARFSPSLLAMLDQDETGLFNIQNAMTVEFPSLETRAVVADVRDQDRIMRVVTACKPDLVYHAAAYKHVPLMELHPEEAVDANVLGTRNMGLAAIRAGASNFVLISTDKAVNPTSVMGAAKRAAEVCIQDLDQAGLTRFVAVRFGNVLGSRGSVVPVFREQIARGGPVTVTDPRMRRYFMTTQEAVLLVLQAGAVGQGGQVLVLDMGEPVKIVDLARQMIALSGFEPDKDIPIVFTGMRPGEKLFEDILTAEEGTEATRHDRIFVARVTGALQGAELQECIEGLQSSLLTGDRETLLLYLRRLVPSYKPDAPAPGEVSRPLAPVTLGAPAPTQPMSRWPGPEAISPCLTP